MKIEYLQIAIGILIGIALCIQFPNLPNQLKQMSKNFKKQQEESKRIGCGEVYKDDKAEWLWTCGSLVNGKLKLCPECSK